jgi:CheY-like chemotaxis protein
MATILIVDDEPDIQGLLTETLTLEGHTVQTAANGLDALNKAQSRSFDLALVDIWLPGMSGIELLERLKDLVPEMPVIIITRDDMSLPAGLKEGSAPEDGGWAVAASPDRKKDRAKWSWGPGRLLDAPQSEPRHLYHCQAPVLYRQEDRLAVGGCWPAAVNNQKPGIHNSAP